MAVYDITRYRGCHDARTQSTRGATERPWCSEIAAYAASGEFSADLLDWEIPKPRLDLWARGINGEIFPVIELPPINGLRMEQYQYDALRQLTVAGGILGMGCGLGKTLTAVSAAIITSSISDTRLWICGPLNSFPAWKPYLPLLRAIYQDVEVLSIDSLHNYELAPAIGGTIIFDEVHLLGVDKARRTKCAHRIRKGFDVGLTLTGTLLHGGCEKVLSMIDLAVPGMSLFPSKWAAGEHFHCLVKSKIASRTVTTMVAPTGENYHKFFNYISRAAVSLTRHDETVKHIVDVPDQHIHTIELAEPWEDVDTIFARLFLQYLTPEHVPEFAELMHKAAMEGVEDKWNWVVDNVFDGSIVAFATYRASLDYVEQWCKDNEVSYVRVDGDVTGDARSKAQDDFQSGKVRVFIGQQDAACTSMNLFAAATSVSLDHSWRAPNYEQALARTARRGQTRETHHYDLVYNIFQFTILTRLRQARNFDSSLAEWQSLRKDYNNLVRIHGPATVTPTASDDGGTL